MKTLNFGTRHGLVKIFWLANILFAGVLALMLWFSYQQHLNYAQERAENTTLTLEKSVAGMLDQIDLVLIAMVNGLEKKEGTDQGNAKHIQDMILGLAARTKHISAANYADAEGKVAANIGFPQGLAAIVVKDRDYFAQLRANPDAGLFISQPITGRHSGRQVLVFSRAYKDKAGQFAGVAYASVELTSFSNLFSSLHLSSRAVLNLLSEKDYLNLARHPAPKDPTVMGKPVKVQTFIEWMKKEQSLAVFIETSKVDQVEKVYALRKVNAWPFFILLGLSTQDELVVWRNQLILAIIVLIIFTSLTGAALWQLRRGWRQQENDFSILQGTLEATDNGILVVADGQHILHRNRRFNQMWQVPENLATESNDRALLNCVLEQLSDPHSFSQGVTMLYAKPGSERRDILEFKDGRVFERTSFPLQITGKSTGIVFSFRDVSEHRHIDELLNFIAQRDWVNTGCAFLPALAQRLGQTLGIDCVVIDKLTDEPGVVETAGFYFNGEVQPNLRYALAGTPCYNVVGKDMCIYRESVQQLFPEDEMLLSMKAESYMGIPLFDSAGEAIGLIAVLDTQPLVHVEQIRAMLNLVASAASTELERQREEKILQLERDRAQSYLDTVEAVIVALDINGRIKLINRRGCELLGWTEAELLGQLWFEKCRPQPDGLEFSFPRFKKMMAEDVSDNEYHENRVLTRSGSTPHIAWHNALLRDAAGHITGTLSAGEDVTERKLREIELEGYRHNLEEQVASRTNDLVSAKEMAEQANRAKSVFLANMSHELRTPLNAILGFAQLLQRNSSVDEEGRNRLSTINRAGQHLLSLINDVLEISRIEAGSSLFQRQAFDLTELLSGVEEMMRERAESNDLHFFVQIAANVPRFVDGDAPHLKQVLINLLGNGIKYTDRGSVMLHVKSIGEAVRFEIIDTGPGISAADQANLFQPFYQTDVGIAKGEGTGLGLAISKEYAQKMGGQLELSSEPGKGCTFTLTLPLVPSENVVLHEAPRQVVGLDPDQVGLKVLVVDDKQDNRELTSQILEIVGFDVRTANDGVQAVALFQSWQPCFIWMDMRMPVMDGYEATRQIRAQAGGDKVKIVALTASAFEEDRDKITAAGCDDMLRKPLEEDKLFSIMGKLLGLRYCYEQPVELKPLKLMQHLPDFLTLPALLRSELRLAAESLDLAATQDNVRTISSQFPELGSALQFFLQEFRFDRIVEFCVEAGNEATS